MPHFNFVITLPDDSKKLFELVTDYENFQQVFPDQLKEVSVVSRNGSEIITKKGVNLRAKMIQCDCSTYT